jgi:predicted oxidoreductase
MRHTTDAVIVGGGLSGLVAACELARAGRRVIVLEQEHAPYLGGQAFWSLGGLFMVDTPEQRRLGIRDSLELARADWFASAGFDRQEDHWPRLWAEAYLGFAAGEMRDWLHGMGLRIFPIVGWAERGGVDALGPGNSVPRFHLTWGTGPGVVEPFERQARQGEADRLITFLFRHRVESIDKRGGAVAGVSGTVLGPDTVERGQSTHKEAVDSFEVEAQVVIVASGGIGANHELVRRSWPKRLGAPPASMLSGVPEHVDGRMIGVTEHAGGRLINGDRMWHYVEGIQNWSSIWPMHGIRILPGPSSLWLDARGRRLPPHLYPGADTMGTLAHLRGTGHDYSWFLTDQSIIRKEFALSGSEQNPDFTGRSWWLTARRAIGKKAPAPVEAFKQKGADFLVRDNLDDLVRAMNALTGTEMLDASQVGGIVRARDLQFENAFGKDHQVLAVHNARRYLGDKIVRTARPHKLLDPAHGPLIAVRLHILTRKTLGGLQTDLGSRVLGVDGEPVRGLYAAGEAAGFGGGGYHGYRALEGTFLGGCLFSGRQAGRAAAAEIL